MAIRKLESTDAFVAIDLDGAEAASGPVRCARKILQGGAEDLARSQTYTYALLGMRRSGAAAGINAEGDDRSDAVAAFVAELAPLVADGTYLPDAAKGVNEAELAPLRVADERDTARLAGDTPTFADRCEGIGAAVGADRMLRAGGQGLQDRTVAIEGFGANGPALAEAVVERGARVIAIATGSGSVVDSGGLAADGLADAWRDSGDDLVSGLGETGAPGAVFGAGADVVFAGSKMGVLHHGVAAGLESAAAVVPCGRLPVTAKAFAVLRRADVLVAADFLALAGSTLALWGDINRTDAEILAGVAEDVGDLADSASAHDDGPLLGACHLAEDFLRSWQERLPFGRPLA